MPGRECFHCKQWIEKGVAHDCWTTTEAALTRELPEDLRDAWERLRETAAEFGAQRIYASHNSIMFSRRACYFFVRPRRTSLEICFFLGRTLKAPEIRRVQPATQRKIAHTVHVKHRDQVEAPITDWLREAFDVSEELSGGARARKQQVSRASTRSRRQKPASKRSTKGRH